MLPLSRAIRAAVDCPVAGLPVPYRTHHAEPTFQSPSDSACDCLPPEGAFPTALGVRLASFESGLTSPQRVHGRPKPHQIELIPQICGHQSNRLIERNSGRVCDPIDNIERADQRACIHESLRRHDREPTSRQALRVQTNSVHNFDERFGQIAHAPVFARWLFGRERLLALQAERALQGVAALSSDGQPFAHDARAERRGASSAETPALEWVEDLSSETQGTRTRATIAIAKLKPAPQEVVTGVGALLVHEDWSVRAGVDGVGKHGPGCIE